MAIGTRAFAASAAAAVALLWTTTLASAQSSREEIEGIVKNYLASNPEEIGQIVRDYMVKHPEAMRSILLEVVRNSRSSGANQTPNPGSANADGGKAIASNASMLFTSGHQVTVGNSDGDVTMVEFFDYNCGFCKRALSDTMMLLKDDPKLKIVLKELPVLGPGSVEAARVAIAVRMQDPTGVKYLEFHQQLLGVSERANKAVALAVAQTVGLDIARLEKDSASEEVNVTLDESRKLAQALGINGTPSYVVGTNVMIGAVGIARLSDTIKSTRK